jgi:hypothetical protein
MLESVPQPDCYLRILPEYGGASGTEDGYGSGPPELCAEVSVTTASRDSGPKQALYQRAGVREYITADVQSKKLRWRILAKGSYQNIEPGDDGVFRSVAFPGLWLNPAHLWRLDLSAMFQLLQIGLHLRLGPRSFAANIQSHAPRRS